MFGSLLFELSRVPVWALVVLGNLVIATVVLLAISDDLPPRPWALRVLLIAALTVIAAAVGILAGLAYAIVHAIETRAFLALSDTKDAPRRIH